MQQVMHMANSIDGSKLTCAWDATVVPAPETDSIEPVQTVDVAIIGAGWTGWLCCKESGHGRKSAGDFRRDF